MAKAEFDLINAIKARLTNQPNVALGVGDDAALLHIEADHQCVISTDTLVSGRHFDERLTPEDIGHKSLAVNLSDLAAMGAEPCAVTVALTLPTCDASWVHAWLDGLLPLAHKHGVSIIGGDTTQGPLSITLTALGQVPTGHAITRSGAAVGDDVWVTGTLGDARAALMHWNEADSILRNRLIRPAPRVAVGLALRGVASACLDLSDGLLGDVRHIIDASGTGAVIHSDTLPVSASLRDLCQHNTNTEASHHFALAGGDDYELCFTTAPSQRERVTEISHHTQVPITRIGAMVAGNQLTVFDDAGNVLDVRHLTGYEHFSA